MSTLKSLVKSLKLLGRRLPLYITAIFMMTAMSALFEVAGSVFIEIIVDAAEKGAVDTYARDLIGVIILGIVATVLAAIFMCIYNNEAKRMTVKLKVMVFEKAMKFPYSYYEEHHSGEIMSKMIYDSDKVSNIFSARLRRVLAPIISVVVFAVAMMLINPIMTMVLIVFNIVLLFINTLISNPVKRVGKKLSQKNSEMTMAISNIISGAGVTKIYDVCHVGSLKYQKLNEEYAKTQKEKMSLAALLEMLNTGFDLLCSVMFIVIGIIMMQQNLATMGEVAAIYSLYTILSFRFLQLGKNMPELVNCISYAERVFEFLNLPEENACEISVAETKADLQEVNAIEFKDIVFGYSDKENIFNGKSYSFESNKITAIVGQSGCGKSTLAKLLLGFYQLQDGDIYVFGQSLKNTNIAKIRDLIAYVPQQPYLYNMSIKDNIRLANESASDQEIYRAAKLANAHEFIERLENGYDTVMYNRGSNLSGGQRQRIAIARAILKNAPVILMDEATSALDNESEQMIADAISQLRNQKTVIMIAHRTATIQLADNVVRFI
ncbi:MAG: ABC transporter ATP-binding protein [Lachnospiraceae bacterium]|nr:ABC transporter ATP-binding protein [Lachnospiraceae bacterium]